MLYTKSDNIITGVLLKWKLWLFIKLHLVNDDKTKQIIIMTYVICAHINKKKKN